MTPTGQSYSVQRIEDLRPVIDALIAYQADYQTYLLTGDLGAGKTTLVKQWMEVLGSADEVSSPTFSLINEYRYDDRSIYHMDMYRLKDIDEAINIGIEEYLYDDTAICIIEWPELIMPLIDQDYIDIQISVTDQVREITITPTQCS